MCLFVCVDRSKKNLFAVSPFALYKREQGEGSGMSTIVFKLCIVVELASIISGDSL